MDLSITRKYNREKWFVKSKVKIMWQAKVRNNPGNCKYERGNNE
jgi:hypothetical protein